MKSQTTLKSGHVLTLQLAPFAIGAKLFKAVAAELRSVEIDVSKIDMNAELNLSKLDPKLLGVLKNVVCEIASSDAIEGILFDCFARCMLDGKKIGRDSFEDPDMRPDYIPAAWEVMRFNLAPFFSGLDLSSMASSGPNDSGQT